MNLQSLSPYKIFCQFISDDITDLTVFPTNLCTKEEGKRHIPTDETEIPNFSSIIFLMGINKCLVTEID